MHSEVREKKISRRLFLKAVGWGSLFVAAAVTIAGTLRFLFPRVLFEEPTVFTIGFPEEFRQRTGAGDNSIHIYEDWKEARSVWVVRENNRLYAMHAKCTHLGCTPNWFPDEGIFKCPCHGTQYDSRGVNFAGPAPRPLDRLRIFIGDDGQICIDKGRTFAFKDGGRDSAWLEI